jgi:hypothetical protein
VALAVLLVVAYNWESLHAALLAGLEKEAMPAKWDAGAYPPWLAAVGLPKGHLNPSTGLAANRL